MSVDRSVPSRSSQVLVLSVRDMQVSLGITVLLCETKVDDVDLVSSFSNSHQKVVGFDVAVNEVARVNVLDAGDLFFVVEVGEVVEREDGEREASV